MELVVALVAAFPYDVVVWDNDDILPVALSALPATSPSLVDRLVSRVFTPESAVDRLEMLVEKPVTAVVALSKSLAAVVVASLDAVMADVSTAAVCVGVGNE